MPGILGDQKSLDVRLVTSIEETEHADTERERASEAEGNKKRKIDFLGTLDSDLGCPPPLDVMRPNPLWFPPETAPAAASTTSMLRRHA